MGLQKFVARESFAYLNGAVGYRPGGPMDCLGPYAKVTNCPIAGTDLRRTCYARGYADTYFSVPAHFQYRRTVIKGFFTLDDGAISFHAEEDSRAVLARLIAEVSHGEG